MVEYRVLVDASRSNTLKNLEYRLEQAERDSFELVGLMVKNMKATTEKAHKWLQGQKSKLAEKLLKGELP